MRLTLIDLRQSSLSFWLLFTKSGRSNICDRREKSFDRKNLDTKKLNFAEFLFSDICSEFQTKCQLQPACDKCYPNLTKNSPTIVLNRVLFTRGSFCIEKQSILQRFDSSATAISPGPGQEVDCLVLLI